jgi:hypothetical protein
LCGRSRPGAADSTLHTNQTRENACTTVSEPGATPPAAWPPWS